MSQTVWIARHGNRIDFVNPAWFDTAERPYDPHLSDDGQIQAKQLANRLVGEGITQIIVSPFLRTIQTANAVAEKLDLPLKLDWGLGEWLNPEWMGFPETLSPEFLAKKFPKINLSHPLGVPNYPENWQNCLQRTGDTAKRLVTTFPQDNLLLVGHGASVLGTAMGLIPTLEEMDIKASLCCLVKIVQNGDKWILEINGDTSHLTESETIIRFN
jgi:broad specificity phosphatase PhoE